MTSGNSKSTKLNTVSNGAYDTQLMYEAVMQKGAALITPPRKNARVRKSAAFVYRHVAVDAFHRLDRGI